VRRGLGLDAASAQIRDVQTTSRQHPAAQAIPDGAPFAQLDPGANPAITLKMAVETPLTSMAAVPRNAGDLIAGSFCRGRSPADSPIG